MEPGELFQVYGSIISFVFPVENRDSAEETIALFKETGIPPRRFNILVPLPGSSVDHSCLEKRIIDDEDAYLEKCSAGDAGFANKKVLLNLTEMGDDEFESLLKYTEKTMEDNYKVIFKSKFSKRGWYIHLIKNFIQRQFRRLRKVIMIIIMKR